MKYAWIVAILLLLAAPAPAMFKMPENVPVERLVKNVGAYARAHPTDAQGWYVLGRVHSLALYLGAKEIGVYGPVSKDELPDVDHQFHEPSEGEKPSLEALRTHLTEGLAAFEKSRALAPDEARTLLGIAYTLEAGADVANTLPPGDEPEPASAEERSRFRKLVEKLAADTAAEREAAEKELASAGRKAWPLLAPHLESADLERRLRVRRLLARLWIDAAAAHYRRAFDLSVQGDIALPQLPIQGITQLVAHEAGAAWLRLVRARGMRPWEAKTIERMRRQVQSLARKPRGIITPIVFPLDRSRPLASLLEPTHRVTFDLDGDLRAESWPWVRSDTGILVWDPEREGRITSGRQLFGSVTWWMLFRDGYQALDALDDDRDGCLRGKELEGLAVWRDGNADGVSDPGEVVPVAQLGIVALRTRPTTRGPDGPGHPEGLMMADGRLLPTFDWTLRSNAGR